MKLTRVRILLLILTAVLLWLWAPWSSDRPAAISDDQIEAEEEMLEGEAVAEPEPAPVAPAAPVVENKPAELATGPVLNAQGAWQDMEACLDLGTAQVDSAGTVDSWIMGLRTSLGEPVLQTEDWSEVELQTPSGERRRVHVGMDYSGDDRIVRRLTYERYLPDGSKEPIQLAPEQAIDPSDTIIATIESDGQATTRQRFQRIYFENGEEILVREQNGQAVDLEVNRGGRQFKCIGIGGTGRCDCIRASDNPNDIPSTDSEVGP